MNEITTKQLKDLLEIQQTFDNRIPSLNIDDSRIAFIVEFFEWFNTIETFKNWKAKPGKPLEVQLDELADMLAFGLSIANQLSLFTYLDLKSKNAFSHLKSRGLINHLDDYELLDLLKFTTQSNEQLDLTFFIAEHYYSVEQLIEAYKKKMKRNHERQNGTADKESGYVQ